MLKVVPKTKKKPVPKKKVPPKKKTTPPVDIDETPEVEEEPKKNYSSLHDVMDTNRPFKLVFSGVENESYYDILFDCGVRSFLMSYHYIQSKHIKMRDRFDGTGVKLFIDSGAHTYQNDPKYLELPLEYWEKHLQKYLNWVERNRKYIFAIASFDFENIVGADTVDRWNREYLEPFMLRTGIPVCFVWHQNSKYDWEFYCKRYPYVGFSSVNTEGEAIELSEYKQRLKIAEKNEALVHGFGMTRTGMLTELPFYTSDSTTWLVGLQYGEMNYWNGTKMNRLKKDKWKSPAVLAEFERRYNSDQTLLEQEDITEVIKVNVFAFLDAEDYIVTKLRSQMYWLKAKTTKRDVNNLPPDFFPDPDMVMVCLDEGDKSVVSYAQKFNINPEYIDADFLVCCATLFLNWDNSIYSDCKDILTQDEAVIKSLHDTLINRIVPGVDEMVEDLTQLFKECISGENDKLLQIGTNFDRAQKEREHYIEEEDEYEEIEVSEGEIRAAVYNNIPKDRLLTAGDDSAPEITELDAEIFNGTGITPRFDDRGKFLKGVRQVKKPKSVYSKKFPKLACATCFAASTCPEYKDGYVCAYNKLFSNYDTRNMSDIVEAMQSMASVNMGRLQKAMLFETLGGALDPQVSQLINQNVTLLNNLKSMYENTNAMVLKQTRNIRQDGSVEESVQVTNPQSMGIMEQLLSKIMPSSDKEDEVIVESEDVTPKKKSSAYADLEEDD